MVIQADRDLFARLLVIREKREVSIKDFMKHSLGPAIWSLATPIGNFYKSRKSDVLTCLEKKINLVKYQLMQQECTTKCVFSVSYQQVFGDLSDYVLKMTTSNNSALIFLITDQYWKVSIKSCECNKQGGSGSIGITAMRPEQEVPKQQK